MCGETTDQLAEAPQESTVLLDSAPPGHHPRKIEAEALVVAPWD